MPRDRQTSTNQAYGSPVPRQRSRPQPLGAVPSARSAVQARSWRAERSGWTGSARSRSIPTSC